MRIGARGTHVSIPGFHPIAMLRLYWQARRLAIAMSKDPELEAKAIAAFKAKGLMVTVKRNGVEVDG